MVRRPMWKINPGHSDDKESHFYIEMTRDQRAAAWIDRGHISIGFGKASEDLHGSSREDITKAMADDGRSVKQAGQLNSFLHVMKPGDLVVFRTPSKIHLGLVGSYYRSEATDDHRHHRRVTWLLSLDRDKRDQDMERATNLRPTIGPILDKAQDDGVNLYAIIVNRFGLDGQYIAPRPPLGRTAEPGKDDYVPVDLPRASAFEATTAATNLHNATQNALLAWLRQVFGPEAVQTFDPGLGWMAQVDLLLDQTERITVIEVKSLQDGNDLDQLRYGLGQTLDYMHRYRSDGRDVHGVLWFSSEPKDSERWQQLCNRYGVRLGWPGTEQEVFKS
jgi:hypothetical protein